MTLCLLALLLPLALRPVLALMKTGSSHQKEPVQTYTLLVKFHKVAGTTFREYVDALAGEGQPCSSDCGNPDWKCQTWWPDPDEHAQCQKLISPRFSCPGRPTSCTFHPSLDLISGATANQNLTVANHSDLAGVENLWPSSKRFWLYWRVPSARAFLPEHMFDLQRKRILVSTILRDPVERIRSWYYYWAVGQSHSTFLDWLQFRRDFVSGNWTQAGLEAQSQEPNFAPTLSTFHMSCCEYEVYLGQGSVERAKVALATQFDVVGITERMSDSIVSLGKLYGKTAEEMAQIGQHIGKDLENSRKLDWTDEEKALATYIANKSTQVYNFGKELFVRQYLSLFGSEVNLQREVARFEALLPKG